MNKTKIVVAALVAIVGIVLGVIVNLKRAHDLHEYAVANKCTWIYQGTAYGDGRDYICK